MEKFSSGDLLCTENQYHCSIKDHNHHSIEDLSISLDRKAKLRRAVGRSRVSRACNFCRAKRVKCAEKQRPCSRCLGTSHEAICQDESELRQSRSFRVSGAGYNTSDIWAAQQIHLQSGNLTSAALTELPSSTMQIDSLNLVFLPADQAAE